MKERKGKMTMEECVKSIMKERLQHPKNNFLCVGKARKGKEIRPVLVTDPKGESEQLKKEVEKQGYVFCIYDISERSLEND